MQTMHTGVPIADEAAELRCVAPSCLCVIDLTHAPGVLLE